MAGRNAGNPRRFRARTVPVSAQQSLGFPQWRAPEIVRILLRPFKPALGAEHSQAQAVFVARRNLTAPEHAARTAFETQKDVPVVIQTSAFDESVKICREGFELQPGHELNEIEGVGPDVSGRTARSALGRIGTPACLFLAA